MKTDKYDISDELFTAFVEGKTNAEETMIVIEAMKRDKSLREAFFILNSIQMNEESTGCELPMARMAAASEGNLCDILCEKRILRDYSMPADIESLLTDASENRWLKEEGTPLHNMGRLLEKSGMSVTRKYDCTLDELLREMDNHNKIMAVVDNGLLVKGESDGVFHAISCISYFDTLIKVYDPALDKDVEYFVEDFTRAWKASRCYMVSASKGRLVYEPHPIVLDDVLLDDDLLELTEAIAENAHEVWARERKNEGWTYGAKRDDILKTTPDMVPYSDLPDSEKEYDRKMAFNTIRLVKKLGFSVSRPSSHICVDCGTPLVSSMHFCPHCGRKLSWEEFV